ncbi:2935_t:CDS:2 [Diversispora eburnea]|uniref:2935_t:CDS:1 n=1 Tax=Diversispora eburnea TaxID=1213867 RepID=A0A9N9FQ42_9GLOM|nr:2935_t:CDS:2 [Diversispora eburnea]
MFADSKDDIIEIYITNLPQESKSLLKISGIDSPEVSRRSKTTINYASFLQRIELQDLYDIVSRWVIRARYYSLKLYEETKPKRLLLYRELCKFFISQNPKLKFSIRLNFIKWDEYIHFQQLSGIIPVNSCLEKLICHTMVKDEIYESIGKIFTEIKDLEIMCDDEKDKIDNKGLASLIDKMRENVTWSLTINRTRRPIPYINKSLEKKVPHLTSLNIYGDGSYPSKIFSKCKLLKKLIIGVKGPEDDKTVLAPFVRHLFVQLMEFDYYSESTVNVLLITMIIMNTRKTLKYLRISWFKEIQVIDPKNHTLLISTIITHCPNLIELMIPLNNLTIDQIPDVMRKCNKLGRIFLNWCDEVEKDPIEMKNWVWNLGETIPSLLQSLYFSNMGFNIDALELFLNRCQQRSIKCLELRIGDWLSAEDLKINSRRLLSI